MCGGTKFRNWLSQAHLANAIALSSAFIAALGFGAAWWQLSRTEQTLRAANTYQVQKDAREIIDKLIADGNFRSAINSGNPLSDQDMADKVVLMLSFYKSVYRQAKSDGLTDEFVDAYKVDFCKFVRKPTIDAFWKKLETGNELLESEIAMRKEWCP